MRQECWTVLSVLTVVSVVVASDGTWWRLLRYFTLGLELVRIDDIDR